MPEAYVRRGTGLAPNQSSKLAANAIYVDSATETLKFSTGTSGTAVKSVLEPVVLTISGDGAITIQSSIVTLTKGSAAAITLAAPTAAQAGTRLVITAGSAFAHVVTATSLVQDGVTGGAKTTLTFGAFLGASIELIAVGLFWHVLGKNVVTIT
jgi:hypothetical protein